MKLRALYEEIGKVLQEDAVIGELDAVLLKHDKEEFPGGGTFCTEFSIECVEGNTISIKEQSSYVE